MKSVFITGGTGYIGTRLIKALQKHGGYNITALVRKRSEHKLPEGCRIVIGNALDANSFAESVKGCDTFIHLIGVAHPGPSKQKQFEDIDLVSIEQSVKAAKFAGVKHFIYISVASYPTKIMQAYQKARAKGESILLNSGIPCSIPRPWYVLGPGHWWPLLLKPLYFLATLSPEYGEAARKLNTVTLRQMIDTITTCIKQSPSIVTYYEVEDIRKF